MPRLLFVTGKLAAPALRDTLTKMAPDFEYELAILPISVAALMDVAFILKNVDVAGSFDKVMLPGLCRGELDRISDALQIETVLGPKNLKDIPAFFGKIQKMDGYGQYSARIVAEIVDAGRLGLDAILSRADYFRRNGADIIDLGCPVEGGFRNIGDVVTALKRQEYMVAVDSFNPEDILNADQAGADFVLSLNSTNLHLAGRLHARPVLVPDGDGDLSSLEGNMTQLDKLNIPYIVDPVLRPIGIGFAESIEKFIKMRRCHPDAEVLMGVGNITELVDADSIGVNAVLAGIAEELKINYLLTTEVISWARGSIRELDIARRLMHYACERKIAPKRIDDRLIALKDTEFESLDEGELRAIQAKVRDRHFRIFAVGGFVSIFNNAIFIREDNLDSILKKLPLQDASEAFYLGKELQKAFLALQLGKSYTQDQDLRWGYLSRQIE